MILAIIIVVIGFGLLFGFRRLLGGLLRGAIGVGLLLLGVSLLYQQCTAAIAVRPSYLAAGFGNEEFAVVYLALALIGWWLWRWREYRARIEAARWRRDGKPRGRGLPSAPDAEDDA